MKDNNINHKIFKKEDLGMTVFFIIEKDGIHQLKVGELHSLIVVTQKAFTDTQIRVMGLEYISEELLKIYNRDSEKFYVLSSKYVFRNYTDACESFKQYIK